MTTFSEFQKTAKLYTQADLPDWIRAQVEPEPFEYGERGELLESHTGYLAFEGVGFSVLSAMTNLYHTPIGRRTHIHETECQVARLLYEHGCAEGLIQDDDEAREARDAHLYEIRAAAGYGGNEGEIA